MKKLLATVVTALALTGALVGGTINVAEAHVPSSACSHWYIYIEGNYTGGMGFYCGTGAPGTLYAGTITCTNGETKSTGLRTQGTGGFGVGCDPGHVVNTHSMILR